MPEQAGDPSVAIARELDRLARRVDDLAGQVGDIGGVRQQLARLAQEVTRKNTSKPAAAPPPSWLTEEDHTVGGELLQDLLGWLDAVYLRYPHTALPSCWMWHPWAVEELAWLSAAHRAAYDPERGSVSAAADWHDRHRPGVVNRIKTGIGSCDLTDHIPGQPAARPSPTAPLQHAHDAIALHWINRRSTPEPTEHDLAEAENHEARSYAR